MFRSETLSARWTALGLFLAATTLGQPAKADHTYEDRITDDTAYMLPEGKHRVGLLDFDWAARDDVMLSAYPLYYGLAFVNGGIKWQPYQDQHFAISLRAHAFYLSSLMVEHFIEGANFDIVTIPVETVASIRFDDTFTASLGAVMTGIHVEGTYNSEEFQGAAAVTNLQTHATLEARLSRLVALVLHGRYMVFQTTRASAQVTLKPDEFTTIEAAATGTTDALDFPNVFSVLPAIHFSWPMYNLRAGFGYGNFNIPGINFMVPKKFILPELDMYWIF